MNQINPYLFFNGNCTEAMRFYESVLGGKLELMTSGQSPAAAHTPPGSADLILHGRLALDGGAVLMASDWMADVPYPGIHGVSVSLMVPVVAEAQRVFDGLSAGGQVTMPFGKTFWAEAFGMLVDRFGTQWMVNAGHAVERPLETYALA